MTQKKRQMTVTVRRGTRTGGAYATHFEHEVLIWQDESWAIGDFSYPFAKKLFGALRPGQTKTFTLTAREVTR